MLVEKRELEKYLERQFDKIVLNTELYKAICIYANEKYDIPKGMISDFVAGRASLSEASEFVLFILLDSLQNICQDNLHVRKISECYSEKEIQYYNKNKYETGKIKFPLMFKMIQVEDDQWIGKIDAKTLMKLREAQLTKYNENAQRTMQRIVKGEKEIYKIFIHETAVDKIVKSFVKKVFIPNTITLNIPAESNANFYYDEETNLLIIKSLEQFDITDGYHRFVSLCRVCDMDKDFNCNMELRIINFTEDKANQFIYQEDQKTKMRKIDSDSMNMDNAANIVVKRLNENVSCNLKGLISRNDGIVPFGEFAELVHYFYFKGVGKEQERSTTLRTIKELTNNFNMLTEYNTKYLEERMDYVTLLSIMTCFDYFKNNNLDNNNLCEIIEKVIQKVKDSDNRKFKIKKIRKTTINDLNKIIEEVL